MSPEPPYATQMPPAPAATWPPNKKSLLGFTPRGIVAVTARLASSIRETVPSPWLTTQTEPNPVAMPSGVLPTPTDPSSRFV